MCATGHALFTQLRTIGRRRAAAGARHLGAPVPGHDNFTLGAFEGSILSAKRQLSESRALRLGLGVSAGRSTLDSEDSSIDENSNNQQALSADVQYLIYPMDEGTIRVFYGGGPTFGFARNHNEREIETSRTLRERTDRRYEVGVTGVLGAEWFVKENISLTAEYGVQAEYDRIDQTIEQESIDLDQPPVTVEDEQRSSFSFGPRPVRLGVSVYF